MHMPEPEKSCGAVVFREENGVRLYLLLHYAEGHWDLPKGHVEKGESEEQTARREIMEETGITQLEFLPSFRRTIAYTFKRKGKSVPKEVVFFLARTDEGGVKLSSEHLDYAWLPIDEAEKKATYRNAKSLLRSAEGFLSSPKKA